MNKHSTNDVERLLESLADQEPPDGLLERLATDVPEVLATPEANRAATLPFWRRRPALVAGLGLAAALALGFGLMQLLSSAVNETARVASSTPAPATVAPSTTPIEAPTPAAAAGALASQSPAATSVAPRTAAPLATQVMASASVPAGPAAFGALDFKVHDAAGAPLPGVTVTVSSPSMPAGRVAVSDVDGKTSLAQLPPGEYRVKLELSGFQEADAEVEVAADSRRTLDTGLSQSAVAETVMVRGEYPNIDARPGQHAASDPALVRQLPVSRDFSTVTTLAPGAVPAPRSTPAATTGSVATAQVTARPDSYAVDGVEAKQIAEEVVVTGNFSDSINTSTSVASNIRMADGEIGVLPDGRDFTSVRYMTSPAGGSVAAHRADVGSGLRFRRSGNRPADELLVVEAREAIDTSRPALRVLGRDGRAIEELPLRHTEVTADIAGFMARTVVEQEYRNTFEQAIEAVYVFPLGAMAAVNDFVMEVGDKRIVGVVRPRAEAERIYKEARERGQTASLLTQERPNIFTQNVANIAPGGTVTITITTFETLAHERGTFEYVFPMVVGPRYIPGTPVAPTPAVSGGGGWSPPTTVVPDADRITPPVLKPGERSGHDIGLTVNLDAGMPITDVRSVAHGITVAEAGPSRRTIQLTKSGTIPNRDFVLRWTVGGERIQVGSASYRERGSGFVALLVQPPLAPVDELVSAREITFVLDVSGSMSGVPIETSKALVRQALDTLRPADAFNIFIFSGGNGQLWPEPRSSHPDNVIEAKRFLRSLSGSGGTEMLAGLKNALGGMHDPARLQMYVFCTDGYVGDEERILAFVKQERGDARFFAFGIGSSVNRYLIDGIGKLGGGSSMVVIPGERGATERAAASFFSLIDAPMLVDAAIDWNGLPVVDAYPQRLGDLFSGGAFNVIARYTAPASGTAYLTGRLGTRNVRIPIAVTLPERSPEHPELAPVWARWRIAELSQELLTATAQRAGEIKDVITELAIEFRLASQFTSFVAVDESEVRSDGKPVRVDQPVPMPEGVRYESVFGTPVPTRKPS
jgi:Ca-activated chloride channel family protein